PPAGAGLSAASASASRDAWTCLVWASQRSRASAYCRSPASRCLSKPSSPPASAGARVLPLPGLALLVEPLEPLARLRVEALRVDVVALGVVRRGHAVEGRVEVLLALDEALVGLLERQRDPAPLQVDVDDLDQDVGAHLDDLLGQLDVPLGQLGDVHQALDAVV